MIRKEMTETFDYQEIENNTGTIIRKDLISDRF